MVDLLEIVRFGKEILQLFDQLSVVQIEDANVSIATRRTLQRDGSEHIDAIEGERETNEQFLLRMNTEGENRSFVSIERFHLPNITRQMDHQQTKVSKAQCSNQSMDTKERERDLF